MKLPPDKIKYIDIPELQETFVDSMGLSIFDGNTLRLELCVTRLNEPKPPKAPTGKKYPVCRLVLTPDTTVELYNQLNQLIGLMAQQGLVKKEDVPEGTIKH